MTIGEAIRETAARFERAGVPDAKYDAAAMLAHILGENQLEMRLDAGREVPAQALQAYGRMASRRERREPMQYILGETQFMGLTFRVAPGVLIPRQDTEILCEEAVRFAKGKHARVLDIGTGSGALAVSIAGLCPDAQVTAVDVSDQALAVARDNAARLNARVRFMKSDCFSAVGGERFDLIVSNPPYIDREEMAGLMREVRFEPELALFGGEDGLDFYRRIAREAPAHLAPGGMLMFEIGWKQREAVETLMRAHIGEPYALRDYGGNWRVVCAALEEIEDARQA